MVVNKWIVGKKELGHALSDCGWIFNHGGHRGSRRGGVPQPESFEFLSVALYQSLSCRFFGTSLCRTEPGLIELINAAISAGVIE
jgi:hypothetical protein